MGSQSGRDRQSKNTTVIDYSTPNLSQITSLDPALCSCLGMSRRRATGGLLILLLLFSEVPAKETTVKKEDHKGNGVASVLHDIHRCRRSTEFLDARSQSLQEKERAGAATNGDFRRERRSPTVDLWHAIRDGFLPPDSSLN